MRNNEALLMFLAGMGMGAALMYFLDPDRGRRRRALMMDKAIGLSNDAREAINATSQDLSNRAYGLYAETRKAVTGRSLSSQSSHQSSQRENEEANQSALNIGTKRSSLQH